MRADVLLDMAVSLDGYVAGPGGADAGLYDWYLNPSDVSRTVIEDLVATTGAIVMGRGAFATGEEAGGWEDTPELPRCSFSPRTWGIFAQRSISARA